MLNVSSPNTPGLRDIQKVDALSSLVREVRAELASIGASVPLLVKISPDLADAEIDVDRKGSAEPRARRDRRREHDDVARRACVRR